MSDDLASLEEIAKAIVDSGAAEIRDVDGGEEPFVYTTGNRGPGYLMIKGLVGQPETLKYLTKQLAHRVVGSAEFDFHKRVGGAEFDFIEGNATGGMIPGWQLRNDISDILGREIPFCYLRGSRKQGGHGELITGNRNNPLIHKGNKVLIVEELVNYAETTSNAAVAFREAGYVVSDAACIFSYDHRESNAKLKENNVNLISLITLPQFLGAAEERKLFPQKAIDSYKNFIKDPLEWQLNRWLVIPSGLPDDGEVEMHTKPKGSVEEALKRGYSMKILGFEEAIERGAPEGKVKEGIVYWAKE